MLGVALSGDLVNSGKREGCGLPNYLGVLAGAGGSTVDELGR